MSIAVRAGGMLALAVAMLNSPAARGQDAQAGSPPERIDLLADAREDVRNPPPENCSPDQDGIETQGPIVVCRRIDDADAAGYDRAAAEARYAMKTRNQGDPRAPDVEGTNTIPMVGVGVTFRGCFIPPCPPPPAYFVDLKSLPETPPGSDAERVGLGLAPRGDAAAAASDRAAVGAALAGELGLPPAPAVSPAGSASPAPER